MRILSKIFTFVGVIVVVGMAGALGTGAWKLYEVRLRIFPSSYQPYLNTDASVYSNVDMISESEFGCNAYAFDRNRYADAIPGAWPSSNIADSNGHVPAFKIGDDIFVVTFKWVNRSSGLAISESPHFLQDLEAMDDYVSVEHLSGNLFAWILHLDYTRQEAATR